MQLFFLFTLSQLWLLTLSTSLHSLLRVGRRLIFFQISLDVVVKLLMNTLGHDNHVAKIFYCDSPERKLYFSSLKLLDSEQV